MGLKRFANFNDPTSLASRMRRKRFALFRGLIERLPHGSSVLDVGGTPQFWEGEALVTTGAIRVTIVNLESYVSTNPTIKQLACDAEHAHVSRQFVRRSFLELSHRACRIVARSTDDG